MKTGAFFLVSCVMLFRVPTLMAPSDAPCETRVAASARSLHAGESVYRTHCMVCHSLASPPKAAPPVKGLSRRYSEAFESRQAGVDHMAAFMKKPEESKAICHKEAIRRFGLMPAMNLSDVELRAVSE